MNASHTYAIEQLTSVVNGQLFSDSSNTQIRDLSINSRWPVFTNDTLFCALIGPRFNGHDFINEVYQKGGKNFLVSALPEGYEKYQANFILVDHTLTALQELGKFVREQSNGTAVAITGSNGKTIVKEWLFQLLGAQHNIFRSPKSYNSQVGVPLALWTLPAHSDYNFIEAGISISGEMAPLSHIIQPEIGIFTSFGDAHDEGFLSEKEKYSEKVSLFKNCSKIIAEETAIEWQKEIRKSITGTWYTWGQNASNFLHVKEINTSSISTQIEYSVGDQNFVANIPFRDKASIENILTILAFIHAEDLYHPLIQQKLAKLSAVNMRLETRQGINGNWLINDTYNNDLNALQIALSHLVNTSFKQENIVVLSDFGGTKNEKDYQRASEMINQINCSFIGIGPNWTQHQPSIERPKQFFANTEDFLVYLKEHPITNATVLLKGARSFAFETINQKLAYNTHQTAFEINLNAIAENLNYFRSIIPSSTKVMVMVKAFGYGNGIEQIADLLQYHKVDYLAVAYTYEGVQLRQNGIKTPIMVMNPSAHEFDDLVQHNLEPEIYSLDLLYQYLNYSQQIAKAPSVHIKYNSGMNRLGFKQNDITELTQQLNSNPNIMVLSVMSHLAGADDNLHDEYTEWQVKNFESFTQELSKSLGYSPIRHILNTAGILRFSQYAFDMVRLGIGLYGVAPFEDQVLPLNPSGKLSSYVSQVIDHNNATIGYGRMGRMKNGKTATIALGYADGIPRSFGNGNGYIFINNKAYRTIGNICMDMFMIDISGSEVQVGDEVIIFDATHSIWNVAKSCDTIPYEILTNIAPRVKRIYTEE